MKIVSKSSLDKLQRVASSTDGLVTKVLRNKIGWPWTVYVKWGCIKRKCEAGTRAGMEHAISMAGMSVQRRMNRKAP